MSNRESINKIFGDTAFERPVFYNNPGGLRFELSESGDWTKQFSTAFNKSIEICSSLITTDFTLCIRIYGNKALSSSISVIRELRDAGLYPEGKKEHWSEKVEDDDDCPVDDYWHTIAFNLPASELSKVLWCCLAKDLGIKPSPRCDLYIFDILNGIEIWAYDDRGMDVVGTNHQLLSATYSKYHPYLLEYDRDIMEETFGQPEETNRANR
jgi:Domain of unknown function (DUF3885)